MGVIIVRELVGTSPHSWSDAARQAVVLASKTVRNIRYVEVIERAVRRDMHASHHDRALGLARRMLDVDSGLDEIERMVVRLFRLTGRHAAAAEQYEHYSASVSELGLEAPPLENL